MSTFNALYYPSWNPPPRFFKSTLLFFDRLEVILPRDVKPKYDVENRKVIDLAPDLFLERKEKRYEIRLSNEGWERFGVALDFLAETKTSDDKIELTLNKDGKLSVDGHVFLHDAKMNITVKSMLLARGLLKADLTDTLKEHVEEEDRNSHIVDERASNLILSLIADDQSRKHGLRTITDEPMPFSLSYLNSETSEGSSNAKMALATSIITTEIPSTIEALSAEEFVELRKKFQDIRQPFQRAIAALAEDRRLGSISDEATLKEAIIDLTREYHEAVSKFRKSPTWNQVRHWLPFAVTTIAALPGVYGPLAQDGLACLAIASGIGVGIQAGVSLYEKLTEKRYEPDEVKSQRLLAGIQGRLEDFKSFRRLASGRCDN